MKERVYEIIKGSRKPKISLSLFVTLSLPFLTELNAPGSPSHSYA